MLTPRAFHASRMSWRRDGGQINGYEVIRDVLMEGFWIMAKVEGGEGNRNKTPDLRPSFRALSTWVHSVYVWASQGAYTFNTTAPHMNEQSTPCLLTFAFIKHRQRWNHLLVQVSKPQRGECCMKWRTGTSRPALFLFLLRSLINNVSGCYFYDWGKSAISASADICKTWIISAKLGYILRKLLSY